MLADGPTIPPAKYAGPCAEIRKTRKPLPSKHEASPQCGLGVGCTLFPSSKELRGMGARAQARRISTSLLFSVAGALVPVFLAWRDEARRVKLQCRVSVRGVLCLSSSLFKPLQRRWTVCITNRDINPGNAGAVHSFKAPLWSRRLELDFLYPTPRYAHRLLLLLRPVVVKKRPQGVP